MFNIAVMGPDISSMESLKKILLQDNQIVHVKLFTQGDEYLKAILSEQVNIAFIYVGKIYVYGMALAKKTRNISSNTRIVLVSETEGYANMAFDEGAWGYITTPTVEEDVKNVLRNIFIRENKRGQRVNRQFK